MKVNRSRFNALKLEWELKKMMSAYIGAEKKIITESASGMADGISAVAWTSDTTTPEQHYHFEMDMFGNVRNVDSKEQDIRRLEEKLKSVEAQGREAIEKEDYESMAELKKLYDILFNKLMRLKNEK